MGKLYVIRHSITKFNTDANKPTQKEKVRGWLDIPLSKDGIEKAEETAKKLKDCGIAKIYSSDLRRAVQTADIVSKEVKAVVIPTEQLRCWNVGDVAGMDGDKALPILKHYTQKEPLEKIPGGEAFEHFFERWKKGLDHLIRTANELPKDLAIACVVHARNIYCLEHLLSERKHPIRFFGFVEPAGVLELDLKHYTLKRIVK